MAKVIDFQSDPRVIWALYDGAFSGQLAFDVGANGGMVSRLLANHFSKVVAYEPHPESFVSLSELGPPVVPVNVALSDHEGVLELRKAETTDSLGQYVTGASLPWGRTTGVATVNCSTLDAQVAEHGVPDFIKIDTEGHEVKVIEGGKELFSVHSPELLIEVHAEENEEAIKALLPDYRFEHVIHPGYPLDAPERVNHFYLLSA